MNIIQKKAFTLLEVLTVIAILAVLASLLFPVFVAARSKARQTQCVSQMRQVVTALNIYRQDYDGVDAGNTFQELGLPDPQINVLGIERYVPKNTFYCPNRYISDEPKDWKGAYSYYDYQTFKLFINFAVKYNADPSWPVICCPFHDYYYWSNKKNDTRRRLYDARKFMGMSLSGSIHWHRQVEFQTTN